MPKLKPTALLVSVISLAGYIWLGYFTQRPNFVQLILIYSILFALYAVILSGRTFNNHFRTAIALAIVFRISLLFMTPNLSDDYFRFIWDGLLLNQGFNPYLVLPSTFINGADTSSGILHFLYEHLNSTEFYSVYPPLCQFIFGLSSAFAGDNVFLNIVLTRLFLIFAEIGSIILLWKLVKNLQLSPQVTLIYIFNPLVIIELTGNLHFEAFMIFFLLLALFFMFSNKYVHSGIGFALAVATKLIPLIFLPALLKRLGIRRSIIYLAVLTIVILLLAAPFFSVQSILNLLSSLRLYFQTFEFNASVYYVARWVGYLITGFNTIAISGPLMSLISLALIIAVSIRSKVDSFQSLLTCMLLCLSLYYFLATTVHPWYLATLVMLSTFSRYKFTLVWSFMAILSYATYQTTPYAENLWLVGLEYVVVGGVFVFEVMIKRRGLKQIRLAK